ncbi:MAG: UDP-N-acetylmuramyl-tripeptide synthetase, partial [Candidatus Woesebacteria bacterium GW2011_GWC2_47_16]
HTPNALESVLTYLREKTKGRLIAVFGCAGERDTTKRPKMAEISTRLADFSVFTAEDPRSEEIEDILVQMERGVKNPQAKYVKIAERGEAIFSAISKIAQKGDTVVICGKGHEKSMAYGEKEYPWSDYEAVEAAIKGKVKKINRK